MFPLAQRGHIFKTREREDRETIADLLSAAFVVPSVEGTQSQLGDETV